VHTLHSSFIEVVIGRSGKQIPKDVMMYPLCYLNVDVVKFFENRFSVYHVFGLRRNCHTVCGLGCHKATDRIFAYKNRI